MALLLLLLSMGKWQGWKCGRLLLLPLSIRAFGFLDKSMRPPWRWRCFGVYPAYSLVRLWGILAQKPSFLTEF